MKNSTVVTSVAVPTEPNGTSQLHLLLLCRLFACAGAVRWF